MARRMPIDVKKLLDSVSVIGKQRDLPVFVDIIYDATAPDLLIRSVMDAFTTTDPGAHIEEEVLGKEVPAIALPADLCVIVAGSSPHIGDVAVAARGRGVPTVVVALDSAVQEADAKPTRGAHEVQAQQAPRSATLSVATEGVTEEDVIEIDPADRTGRPFEELGVWIAKHVDEKALSMASDFEFLRHPMAGELAIGNSIQNGAISTVFFMPGADMPLITLNQAKMVLEIATVYGHELDKGRIKELVAVVAGAYGLRGVARMAVRQVPGLLGIPVKAAIAFTGTLAMGYAAIDYFEEGGVVQGVTENAEKLYRKADGYAHGALRAFGGAAASVKDAASKLAEILPGRTRTAPDPAA